MNDSTNGKIWKELEVFKSEKADLLVDIINQMALFFAEMKEFNAEKQQAHILLYPKGCDRESIAV